MMKRLFFLCGWTALLLLAACGSQDTAVNQPEAEPVQATGSEAKPRLIEFYADW